MKNLVLLVLCLVVFSTSVSANYDFDFVISFSGQPNNSPLEVGSNLVGFQYITRGNFEEYLVDPNRQTAYVKGNNFLTEDFYIHKALENENGVFNVEGASESCRLTFYQVNVDGEQVDATSLNRDSQISFSLSKGDEIYLSVSPLDQGLCSFRVGDVDYKIDFVLQESAEQYVNRFKYDCEDGQECFRTNSGEEVNVTEWSDRGCSFEVIRQGNQACQDWYTSELERVSESKDETIASLKEQTQPEIVREIEGIKGVLVGLSDNVEDNDDALFSLLQVVIFGGIVLVGLYLGVVFYRRRTVFSGVVDQGDFTSELIDRIPDSRDEVVVEQEQEYEDEQGQEEELEQEEKEELDKDQEENVTQNFGLHSDKDFNDWMLEKELEDTAEKHINNAKKSMNKKKVIFKNG